MKTDEQIGREAGREAQSETRKALRAHGITVEFIARRLREDLDRKETKTFKLKGAPYDLADYIEQEAAKILGKKPPKPKGRRSFRVLAKSTEESVVAVDMDCIDAQIDARKDAAKLLGLYVDQLELSGPGGSPITYDSIPPARREQILEANRLYQRIRDGKIKPKEKARGKSGSRKKKK